MVGKEIEAKCGHCGSGNVYGISRVVGYYSRINNWNKSKQAEFRDRQKGEYKLGASTEFQAAKVAVTVKGAAVCTV